MTCQRQRHGRWNQHPIAKIPCHVPDQPNFLGHCLSSSPQDSMYQEHFGIHSYSPRKTLKWFCQSPDHTMVKLSSSEPGAATFIIQRCCWPSKGSSSCARVRQPQAEMESHHGKNIFGQNFGRMLSSGSKWVVDWALQGQGKEDSAHPVCTASGHRAGIDSSE